MVTYTYDERRTSCLLIVSYTKSNKFDIFFLLKKNIRGILLKIQWLLLMRIFRPGRCQYGLKTNLLGPVLGTITRLMDYLDKMRSNI